MDNTKIIVVEDKSCIASSFANLLAREGFRTVQVFTSRQQGNIFSQAANGWR